MWWEVIRSCEMKRMDQAVRPRPCHATNLGAPQHRARQADKLPLPHAEVLAVLCYRGLEPAQLVDRLQHADLGQSRPQRLVSMLIERIDVETKVTAEQHRILWTDAGRGWFVTTEARTTR